MFLFFVANFVENWYKILGVFRQHVFIGLFDNHLQNTTCILKIA